MCLVHFVSTTRLKWDIVYWDYAIIFQDNIRDITDSLIDHCEDRKLDENSNVEITDEKIVGIVNDLFGAGRFNFFRCWLILPSCVTSSFKDKQGVLTRFCLLLGFDTISTALSWSVMYLVSYPEIQERLYQELSEYGWLTLGISLSFYPTGKLKSNKGICGELWFFNQVKIWDIPTFIIILNLIVNNLFFCLFAEDKVGLDRTPLLSDKTSLPFLEAFILETFRHSSFLPFTIPHWWDSPLFRRMRVPPVPIKMIC